MAFDMNKHLAAGTKVRVAEPTDVPAWSTWDDDRGRTSATLKKRIQAMFFRGNRKITAEVLYVGRESERAKLLRKNQIKLRLKEASGIILNITADPGNLKRVG